MGTRSFPGVKCGRGVLLTITPFSCRGHGRVELYLYPSSGPHRACNGITLLLIWWIAGLEVCGMARAVTGLLPWITGFYPGTVYLGFVVEEVALGQAPPHLYRFPQSVSFLLSHLYLNITVIRRRYWRNLGNFKQNCAVYNMGRTLDKMWYYIVYSWAG